MNMTRHPLLLSSRTLCGDRVKNAAGEDLGKIEDLMIDLYTGRIAYAVLSFGGFLKMGNKLFAVPWEALTVDTIKKEFVLHVDKSLDVEPASCESRRINLRRTAAAAAGRRSRGLGR